MLKIQSTARGAAGIDHRPLETPSKGAVERAFEGLARAGRGDLAGALRCLHRALERDVDCPAAWSGLSTVFLAIGDGRRAEACLDVARLIRRRRAPEATA
jgi:Flp pilus assembly protein TadD